MTAGKLAGQVLEVVARASGRLEPSGDADGERVAADTGEVLAEIVGHERRYCALAADDPWAKRRSIRLDEIPQRTLLIDRRTGTTSCPVPTYFPFCH
jgi:hypothetical protein